MSGPIFVGGTGRSGTTVVGRVLGSDPDSTMIPIETRFLVDQHGLCDVVAGTTSMKRFEQHMRGRWFHTERADGSTRGVHSIIDADALDEALGSLRDEVTDDPVAAARRYVRRLFDPIAERDGARRWVEMTPPNVIRGSELVDLMGADTRVLHSIRDGRDVAASVSRMSWGPNDPFEALEWWAERMKAARRGCSRLGPAHLFVVQLEQLVSKDRQPVVEALAAFAGLGAEHLERDIERRMSAERAHTGRWHDEVAAEHHTRFNARYDELRDTLTAVGCVVPI